MKRLFQILYFKYIGFVFIFITEIYLCGLFGKPQGIGNIRAVPAGNKLHLAHGFGVKLIAVCRGACHKGAYIRRCIVYILFPVKFIIGGYSFAHKYENAVKAAALFRFKNNKIRRHISVFKGHFFRIIGNALFIAAIFINRFPIGYSRIFLIKLFCAERVFKERLYRRIIGLFHLIIVRFVHTKHPYFFLHTLKAAVFIRLCNFRNSDFTVLFPGKPLVKGFARLFGGFIAWGRIRNGNKAQICLPAVGKRFRTYARRLINRRFAAVIPAKDAPVLNGVTDYGNRIDRNYASLICAVINCGYIIAVCLFGIAVIFRRVITLCAEIFEKIPVAHFFWNAQNIAVACNGIFAQFIIKLRLKPQKNLKLAFFNKLRPA